ncbi:MAG: T9SS type A sorting domain-containing protein [Bacteroidetes bacterium]|nr:T9SS type A sorting domain-containing protein [Bacteroidota bacterium]
MNKFVQLSALILLIVSPVGAQEIRGLYIGNQGNFSDGNGSITWYDFSTRQTEEVVSNFGTIVQSITLDGNFGYIASNTSSNVDILDLSTNMRVGQIREIGQPRYISIVSSDKAYVTEHLGLGRVRILNLQSRSTIESDTISTGYKPEDIAVVGNRAFVANNGYGRDSTLTVINTQTDTVIETIDLGCDGPRHLEVDSQNEIWAFCTGNTLYSDDFSMVLERTNGQAVVLNPLTGKIIERIEFNHQIGSSGPGQDSYYSPASEEIFLIRSDTTAILIFDTASNSYKETLPLSGDERVGGLAYDADARQLYIGRFDRLFAIGFTQPGFVQIANRDDLSEVDRFTVGIAPAHLVFHQSPQATALDQIGFPEQVDLFSNYPNPFNRTTTLSFTLDQNQQVSLVIYDALGREIDTPISGFTMAGKHTVVWEASHLPAGTYFSRLVTDNQVYTQTLVRTR